MVRRFLSAMIVLATLTAFAAIGPSQARAVERQPTSDLFYNYYVPPGGSGGVAAQLYTCPRPTPRLVGHTYITYQPFMPHEFLHKHCRTYWRWQRGTGVTRTSVIWQ